MERTYSSTSMNSVGTTGAAGGATTAARSCKKPATAAGGSPPSSGCRGADCEVDGCEEDFGAGGGCE